MNKVLLVGRLGRDPDVTVMANGAKRARLALAVDRPISRAKKDGGAQSNDWFRITAWDSVADFAQTYLTKGRLIEVEARLATRTYSQNGQKMYEMGIVAERITFANEARPAVPQPAIPITSSGGTVPSASTQPIAPPVAPPPTPAPPPSPVAAVPPTVSQSAPSISIPAAAMAPIPPIPSGPNAAMANRNITMPVTGEQARQQIQQQTARIQAQMQNQPAVAVPPTQPVRMAQPTPPPNDIVTVNGVSVPRSEIPF